MDPILIFNITNQEIERADEFTVVESSVSYLKAQFNCLTDDWDGMIITGVFIMEDGTPIPSLSDENGLCDVPEAWLVKQKGYVGAIGSNGATKITTRAVKVSIREKGYTTEAMDEETQGYFDQVIQAFAETKTFVTQEADRAEAAEKSAEAWAHGHADYPERGEDNAAYYASEARGDALQTAADRTAVTELAEHADSVSQTVAADLEKVEGFTAQAQSAAENALQSEQAAKTSQEAAEAARAGAEAAEGQAELYAGQTSEDKTAVEAARTLVMQMGQEVADNKQSIEQTADAFNLAYQQAVADVNNAGQNQTERVQEAGGQAVDDIAAAKTQALSETTTAGAAQVKAVNDAGTAKTAEIATAGAAQLKAVNDAGASQVSSITQEGAAQVENVQQAAAEIIADRDQIETNRQNILKNTIKRAASGKTILLSDSAETPFAGLKQYGWTKQETTTGVQLLKLIEPTTITQKGITVTVDSDGTVTVDGTCTDGASNVMFNIFEWMTLDAGTYTVSFIKISGSATTGGNFQIAPGIVYTSVADSGKTFTAPDGIDNKPNIRFDAGQTFASYKVKIMLNAGDTALPWEPYTGGIPSPNPDYPQELVSAGDKESVETLIFGGNLFNKDSPDITNGKYLNSGGLLGINDLYSCTGFIRIISKTEYFINSIPGGAYSIVYGADKSTILNKITGTEQSIYAPEGAAYLRVSFRTKDIDDLFIRINDISGSNDFAEPQVITHATPNGLPGIPVSSGGNYTDESGQQWIANYRDWERGVDVQHIFTKIIEENDLIHPTDAVWVKISVPSAISTVNPMCTHLRYIAYQDGDSKHFVGIARVINSLRFYLDSSDFQVYKDFVNSNNVIIAFALETPIETPIPADELAAYHAVHTNYPYTTIYNDEGVWTEVEYGIDTEECIDAKVQEGNIMTDEATGKKYILGIKDGLLTVFEVIE